MKHLEYYNYNYLDKKKIKKELNSDIKKFKKIQYRNTETKLGNLNLIKNKILNLIKNNKNI